MYTDHLVVGADGVHGVTHGEMYRNMAQDILPPKLDTCTVTVSYSGIFGTSTRTVGLEKGVAHRTYGHLFSFIVTVGKDKRVHGIWPFAEHNIQPSIMTREMLTGLFSRISLWRWQKGVYFDQAYQKCISCCHVPLEEALQP